MSDSFTKINPDLGPADASRLTPRVEPLSTMTPPDEVVIVPEVWYVCSIPNASFHRKDGTRIGFTNGVLKTDVEATQKYLDQEIKDRNPYVKRADGHEINEARMKINPRELIREQVKDELEATLRQELEAKIRQELGLIQPTVTDEQKIAGTSELSDKLKGAGLIKVPGATMVMSSKPAPLQGIVGSDAVKDGASSSGV